jgi:hypothetical protein
MNKLARGAPFDIQAHHLRGYHVHGPHARPSPKSCNRLGGPIGLLFSSVSEENN